MLPGHHPSSLPKAEEEGGTEHKAQYLSLPPRRSRTQVLPLMRTLHLHSRTVASQTQNSVKGLRAENGDNASVPCPRYPSWWGNAIEGWVCRVD